MQIYSDSTSSFVIRLLTFIRPILNDRNIFVDKKTDFLFISFKIQTLKFVSEILFFFLLEKLETSRESQSLRRSFSHVTMGKFLTRFRVQVSQQD